MRNWGLVLAPLSLSFSFCPTRITFASIFETWFISCLHFWSFKHSATQRVELLELKRAEFEIDSLQQSCLSKNQFPILKTNYFLVFIYIFKNFCILTNEIRGWMPLENKFCPSYCFYMAGAFDRDEGGDTSFSIPCLLPKHAGQGKGVSQNCERDLHVIRGYDWMSQTIGPMIVSLAYDWNKVSRPCKHAPAGGSTVPTS